MTMLIAQYRVESLTTVAENIFVLRLRAPGIASTIEPGQFLNIRVEDALDPLLRRPFSVYRVDGESLEIIFNVVGKGTASLSRKRPGDMLDVLGPLGVPFSLTLDDYSTAVLIGGGLGVAPLPVSTAAAVKAGKKVLTFLGARTEKQLVTTHLQNLSVATDDGSHGFRGTVVELAARTFDSNPPSRPRIFACGPTAMLRAVAEFAIKRNIPCEVSLEGPMACGIGICQGCPVELVGPEKKFALMCKDGPTFDVRTIKI